MPLAGTNILDLGCGTGLLGVYLCCLGANTFLADVPSVRDLAERNISLNKNLLKGKSEFISVNW
jgi:predicted RNA methylase